MPSQCTGPSTPVDTACRVTVPGEPAVTTTTTIPGFNPGCRTTPTITSYFGCPAPPPCNQHTCVPLTLGGGAVVTSCGAVPCAVVTEGTLTEEATATGLPLKCRPTSGTTTTTSSTTTPAETGPQPSPPPPLPTDDCDPFDPTC